MSVLGISNLCFWDFTIYSTLESLDIMRACEMWKVISIFMIRFFCAYISFSLVDSGSHQLLWREGEECLSQCSKPICKNITQNSNILFVFNVKKSWVLRLGPIESSWYFPQIRSVFNLTKIRGTIMSTHDCMRNSLHQMIIHFSRMLGQSHWLCELKPPWVYPHNTVTHKLSHKTELFQCKVHGLTMWQ